MIRHRLGLCTLLAGALAIGCGDDDPAEPPGQTPPDISGTYSLQSFSSAVLTAGNVLTPPAVSGTLTLQQSAGSGSEAMGSFSIDVTVPDASGGSNQVVDQGSYTVRADGSWEQAGQVFQGTGTFALSGSTLTVNVTQPALNVSTSVWRRQ